MRSNYKIRIPKVRAALETLARIYSHSHPLIDQQFETDEVDLFITEIGDEIVNLCHGGQMVLILSE
jgi:hypothetical protein